MSIIEKLGFDCNLVADKGSLLKFAFLPILHKDSDLLFNLLKGLLGNSPTVGVLSYR